VLWYYLPCGSRENVYDLGYVSWGDRSVELVDVFLFGMTRRGGGQVDPENNIFENNRPRPH
jgi:hypothetical protein